MLVMPAPADRRHARRNVTVNGRRTSIRMERLFWTCLEAVCRERGVALDVLLTEIDDRRGDLNLTAAVRLHLVATYHRKVVARHARPAGLVERTTSS
jgi:predicted DNA-binding ribbon-helix-helix protein